MCLFEKTKLKNKGVTNDNDSTDNEIFKKYYCIHFPHKASQVVLDFATKHQPTIEILQTVKLCFVLLCIV